MAGKLSPVLLRPTPFWLSNHTPDPFRKRKSTTRTWPTATQSGNARKRTSNRGCWEERSGAARPSLSSARSAEQIWLHKFSTFTYWLVCALPLSHTQTHTHAQARCCSTGRTSDKKTGRDCERLICFFHVYFMSVNPSEMWQLWPQKEEIMIFRIRVFFKKKVVCRTL